MNYEKSTNRCS